MTRRWRCSARTHRSNSSCSVFNISHIPMFNKTVSDPEFGNIVIHKNRQSRRVTVRVRSKAGKDGALLYVTVPLRCTFQDGLRLVEEKREWIRRTLAEIQKKYAQGHISFVDGSTLNTLLTEIRIHIRPFGDRPPIELIQEPLPKDILERPWHSPGTPLHMMDIYVNTDAYGQTRQTGHEQARQADCGQVSQTNCRQTRQADMESAIQNDIRNAIVEHCLRKESKIFLRFKLEHFAAKYGFKFGRLAIKHNSTNWGSCSRQGNINLNLNLMRLPEPLCDYVILHELCHLREPNHGPKFHALLEQLCLDNLRSLTASGSLDAMKYGQWLVENSLPPLDRVLSREIKKFGLI